MITPDICLVLRCEDAYSACSDREVGAAEFRKYARGGSIVYSRPKASIRARPKAGARTTHCYTKWNLEGARRGGPTNRSYVINKYRTQTATTDLNVVTSEASAANSLHSGDATNAEPQPKAEARDIHTYT